MTRRRETIGAAVALAWRAGFAAIAAAAVVFILTLPSEDLVPSAASQPARLGPAQATRQADANAPNETRDYAAIAAHPLFFPTRAPWEPPPPPPPDAPPSTAPEPLTGYALVGVVASGATRLALIKPSRGSSTIILAEGQQLDGWTLEEISREGLRFGAGDARYEMSLVKPSEASR